MAFFKKKSNSPTPHISLTALNWRMNWQRPRGFLLVLLQPLVQKATSNARAILLVNGILVLLIAYHLATITWLALPTLPQEDAPTLVLPPVLQTAVAPNPQATAGNTLITPQDIANWHLLGEANAVPINSVENAPPTSLALSLHGIIASRDRKTARAIIADSSGTENFYALDAQVPGGAVLKEIHADRVILLRGGGHETLMLPKDALEGGLEGEREQFGAPPLPIAHPDEAMMDEYRDALQNHPETLADRIQPMPVHQGGKFVGYRFLSPRDPTLLSRLGMQPGDIVTAVNGTQLDNPLKGVQVLRGISAEDEIRVDTLRNGTPRSFVLRMN